MKTIVGATTRRSPQASRSIVLPSSRRRSREGDRKPASRAVMNLARTQRRSDRPDGHPCRARRPSVEHGAHG